MENTLSTGCLSSSLPAFGEPVWSLAELFPSQGCWREQDYLELDTNRRVEFSDGYIEVLPVPTTTHQMVLLYLLDMLRKFVGTDGFVMFSGVRVRLRPRLYREPDIVFMASNHLDRIGDQFWEGADLVLEVVSADDASQRRDYEQKVRDYAEGGVPEYWIVDPQAQRIRVLVLENGVYRTHGDFVRGQQATSVLLNGLSVDVSATLDAGKLPSQA